ncbi:MAG TPA: methanol dehydrogenase [Gammaproteobacteria bacterium]|nr:methanol dehydrogenase [Gammaproteobacteria bacterium]
MLWLVCVSLAQAAPQVPALTGRVMDQADLLSPDQERTLTDKLAAIEATSSNQIVVVTLPDLQGHDIADHGLAMGRAWGIGQAGKDNGALLIIAVDERKVRIEVGRGLEGHLTDAVSHRIIRREIRPAFRQGEFARGITQGIDAMIAAIDGSYTAEDDDENDTLGGLIPLFFIAVIALAEWLKRRTSRGVANGVAIGGVIGLMVTIATQTPLYGVLAGVAAFVLMLVLGNRGGGSGGAGQRQSHPHGTEGYSGHDGFSGGLGGGLGGGGFGGGGGGFGGGGASGGW